MSKDEFEFWHIVDVEKDKYSGDGWVFMIIGEHCYDVQKLVEKRKTGENIVTYLNRVMEGVEIRWLKTNEVYI